MCKIYNFIKSAFEMRKGVIKICIIYILYYNLSLNLILLKFDIKQPKYIIYNNY